MRNLALVWVLAACLLGCGGREAKDKAAATDTADTVAVVADTAVAVADTDSTFTDTRDGKVYKILKIGERVWMSENLDYATEGSVFYDKKKKYDWETDGGRLYDWAAANKACPAGFRLPGNAEWGAMSDIVGFSDPSFGGGWWSATTKDGVNYSWHKGKAYWGQDVNWPYRQFRDGKPDGPHLFYVRCVRDDEKERRK